ncbi:pyruvoyl-dependent arginine decarboxylase [Saccharothrix sp. HUAS TT1]|uniref:pyruvoyl-dependent arginine decarboxylase n=1 Tax=unclassified Saccharothrix TaxID=2593673 RepID=UPI00345C5A9C
MTSSTEPVSVPAPEGTSNVYNRIPGLFFRTTGIGDTDEGSGDNPWETGSYDYALINAGIANFNILEYTSVLPAEARAIPLAEAKKHFHHGSVLECIMAHVNGKKNDILTAGVGSVHVWDKQEHRYIGGYACEYTRKTTGSTAAKEKEKAEAGLTNDLKNLLKRRYPNNDTAKRYIYDFPEHLVTSVEVKKTYGTALASLCWITFGYADVPTQLFDAVEPWPRDRDQAGGDDPGSDA